MHESVPGTTTPPAPSPQLQHSPTNTASKASYLWEEYATPRDVWKTGHYLSSFSVKFKLWFFFSPVYWSGTSKENTHNLQLLQNFPTRISTSTKENLSYISPILNELGWFSIIDELLKLCDATIIYKCINSLLQPISYSFQTVWHWWSFK